MISLESELKKKKKQSFKKTFLFTLKQKYAHNRNVAQFFNNSKKLNIKTKTYIIKTYFHYEDYFTPPNIFPISLKLLPFVSGNHKMTIIISAKQNRPNAHMQPYI